VANKKTYAWADPSGPAKVAFAVMGLNILLRLISLAAWMLLGPASTYLDQAALTPEQTVRAMLYVANLGMLLVCMGAGWWIYRANANAHTFRAGLVNSPFGAIAWFYVPIANLYKPYQAMRETWIASSQQGLRARHDLVRYWWASMILGNFAGNFAARVTGSFGLALGILFDLLAISTAVMFVLIVRRVTAMQISKHEIRVFDEANRETATVLERMADGV
jgi:hypothetical protein